MTGGSYQLCGLRLDSELVLPELLPWDGPLDVTPDVEFRVGVVPNSLETPDHVTALYQTQGRQQYLLSVPDVGRFLVTDGRQILIAPAGHLDETRFVLMGTAQGVLWHQRGLLPLHATSLEIGGRAIVIAGGSGAGKTTLAAAIVEHSGAVAADDISVVETQPGSGAVRVVPGYQRLRLWRDALDALRVPVMDLSRAHAHREKFVLERWPPYVGPPLPIACVVILSRFASGKVEVETLGVPAAISSLLRVVHMRAPARALGCDPQIFAALTTVVAAGIPIRRISRPDDLSRIGEVAERVLDGIDAKR